MKKIFTLLLAMLAMNGVANADDYLSGSWDWQNDTKFDYTGDVGIATVSLVANKWYNFGLKINGNWITNGGDVCAYNHGAWTYTGTEGTTSILTGPAGEYTFTITWDGSTPSVEVTYPEAHKTTVHFSNDDSWEVVKAYRWCNGGGNGDYVLSSGWPGDVISTNSLNDGYYDVTFTDYTNRIQINNGTDIKKTSDLIVDLTASEYWVTWSESTASITSTKPETWVDYQRTGLDADDLGTICLPYAAKVVSGGSVYKIASKVMNGDDLAYVNITPVDALEAGHAYIFQADGTGLNIQYTGTDAVAAVEADGMEGNLAADAVTVAQGNYVLGGNLLHKVTGDGVTAAQNRAWITLTGIGDAEARGQFFIGFADESTGIESVKGSDNGNAAIYNLSGQRVKNAANGLYIQNGRKYVVK